MRPVLYDKNETTFTSNGKGTLDFMSCVITEERNGIFELEADISESAYHASEIEMNSFLKAKVPDQTDAQLFRVYKITKPLNGVYKIYAQHISYQLSYVPTMPFAVSSSSSACSQALAGLKTNAAESCPFTFSTDVTTVASFKVSTPVSLRKALGGMDGSVLDRFKGEYKWNNYTVSFLKNRGVSIPTVTLRYGKDITDINQEENISNTVTGVVPFWQSSDGSEIVTLTEKVVDSQYASAYPFKRTVVLDCSQDFEEKPTQLELRTHAQAYVNQTGLGIPTVSIKVSFINLKKDIANELQEVKLCDNIGVVFEKLGINTTAKVVKYTYDVLKERYISIEVGTIKQTLATTISGNMEDIEGVGTVTKEMIQRSTTTIEGDIDDALDDAKDYADGVASTAQSNAETYADGAASTAQSNAESYAAGAASSAETNAKNYASGAASTAETNAKNYAAGVASTAESNAKVYTDTQLLTRPTTQQVNTAIDNATAWLTGSNGYVMAVKDNNGKWQELIFADHNDPSNWVNVLRINENGIGFSSDGGVHYTQAWTLDGKLVIGGTDVPSLTVYDNNNNVIFQTTASGTIWNSTNSSMTATGILTAIGAVLTNCTLSNKNSTTHYGISIDENSINFSLSDTNHANVEYTYDTYEYRVGTHWYTASYYMLKMLCDNIVMLKSNSGSGANIQVGTNNAGSITLDATAGIWIKDTHQNYGGELTVLNDMITDFELTISPYDYINVVDDIWYDGDCVSWSTTSVASDYTVGVQNVQRGNYLCV